MNSIILTGGGTAGHVTPNLALIPDLRKKYDEIHYVGSENGMEREMIGKVKGVTYHAIPCAKLDRSSVFKNFGLPFVLADGVKRAKKLIAEIKPRVIFSKGGYVGLPVSLASGSTPLIIHESDLTIGLANRLALKKADRFLTAFEIDHPRAERVGAPLRAEIYRGNGAKLRKKLGLTEPLPVLLITGGSLGAQAINEIVEKSLGAFTDKFNVIHLGGKQCGGELFKPRYARLTFTDDMPGVYSATDVAVTRGGANTLFELASLAIPALVIPLPKGASRGDQIDNARYFSSLGCARTLLQSDLTPQSLTSELDSLLTRADRMRLNAKKCSRLDGRKEIAEILCSYAK